MQALFAGLTTGTFQLVSPGRRQVFRATRDMQKESPAGPGFHQTQLELRARLSLEAPIGVIISGTLTLADGREEACGGVLVSQVA